MRRRASYLINTSSRQRICFGSFEPDRKHAFATSLGVHQIPSAASRTLLNSTPLARHVSKSAAATVHVGTTYERLCLRVLHRLGFSLTRTGGRSDKGIDLLGLWHPPVPPSASSPLRVVVQCKAYAGQVYPALIRELEGAVAGGPVEWRSDNTIGVLCAPKGATSGIRDAVRMAEKGVIWVTIEEAAGLEEDVRVEGRVTQLLWNEKVSKMVRNGLGAGLKYVPGTKGLEQEVVLMLDGRVWEVRPSVEEEDEKGQDLEEENRFADRSSI